MHEQKHEDKEREKKIRLLEAQKQNRKYVNSFLFVLLVIALLRHSVRVVDGCSVNHLRSIDNVV